MENRNMRKNYISPKVKVVKVNLSGSMLTTSNMGVNGSYDSGSVTIATKERGDDYDFDSDGSDWNTGLW